MKYNMLPSLLATLAITLSACGSSNSKLETTLGESTYATLSTSEHVTIVKVAPSRKSPYISLGEPKELNHQQINELRKLLLSDTSYIFDSNKRCIFIPEASYQFSGDKKVEVYVSVSCQQIKVLGDKGETFIDYDPMAEKFNTFSQSLFNISNPQKPS
jgi:hypothetical protein